MDNFHIESFQKQPNYLLTMSQSARVLGNKDYRFVEKLIQDGLLNTYCIPGKKKVFLRYHEVMKLPQPNEQKLI